MPQDNSGDGSRPPVKRIDPAEGRPTRGRILVEPTGYAVTSFLTGIGLTVGLGLAPSGLLLFAAALILEVIEFRRLRAANPWLRLETPDDMRTFEGRLLMRFSAWNAGVVLAMAITAYSLVNTQPGEAELTPMGDDAAAIGPALVAGVATLAFNYLLKRKLAKGPASGDASTRMGDEPIDDGQRTDDRDRDDREDDGPYRPANWVGPSDQDDEDAPRADDRPLAEPDHPPAPDPDADPDDDGFQDQDYSALHGKQLEPRTKAKAPKKRRRGDRDAS